MFAGGRHFENNWLGTGGHHALVPSGLAAFVWAVTLFVSQRCRPSAFGGRASFQMIVQRCSEFPSLRNIQFDFIELWTDWTIARRAFSG